MPPTHPTRTKPIQLSTINNSKITVSTPSPFPATPTPLKISPSRSEKPCPAPRNYFSNGKEAQKNTSSHLYLPSKCTSQNEAFDPHSLDPPTTFQEIFARLPWYWDLKSSKYEMVMKKIAEEGWTLADVSVWKKEQEEKKRKKKTKRKREAERTSDCDRRWRCGL